MLNIVFDWQVKASDLAHEALMAELETERSRNTSLQAELLQSEEARQELAHSLARTTNQTDRYGSASEAGQEVHKLVLHIVSGASSRTKVRLIPSPAPQANVLKKQLTLERSTREALRAQLEQERDARKVTHPTPSAPA